MRQTAKETLSECKGPQALTAWVASIVERERQRGTSGSVRVEMQGGVVQRVRVEVVEKAPKPEEAAG